MRLIKAGLDIVDFCAIIRRRSRVNRVVVGPFEEEEEGNGVASDVVKVEGEDPATPDPLT